MSCNSCSSCNAYTIINHHVKRAVNVCGNNRPCILSSLCYKNCTILPYSGVISEYSYTFTNFILPSSYTRIHFYLYGPGAYVGTNTYNGGGSGAFISLNIPYSFKASTICKIYFSTGFPTSDSSKPIAPSTVVITYTDSSQITLSAGYGSGQNGGIANITNSSNIPLGAVIAINGKNGGSEKESGESSTLTVSGSGRKNDTSLSPVSNVAPAINSIILPTSATTQMTVNVSSSGGGKTSSSSTSDGIAPLSVTTNGGPSTYNYIGGGGGSADSNYTYTSNGTTFYTRDINAGGNGLILFGVTK